MLKTEHLASKIYPGKKNGICNRDISLRVDSENTVIDNPGNCYGWDKFWLSHSHHNNIRQMTHIIILNILLLYLRYTQKTHLDCSILFSTPLLHDSYYRCTKSSAEWIVQYSFTYPYLKIKAETFQYQWSENSNFSNGFQLQHLPGLTSHTSFLLFGR